MHVAHKKKKVQLNFYEINYGRNYNLEKNHIDNV